MDSNLDIPSSETTISSRPRIGHRLEKAGFLSPILLPRGSVTAVGEFERRLATASFHKQFHPYLHRVDEDRQNKLPKRLGLVAS